MDLDSHTPISEQELRVIFNKFDEDGSGSISEDELRNAMRMLGVRCSPNSAKKFLKAIDKDNNGTIEWPEFYEFFSRASNPEEVKMLISSQNQRFFEYKLMVEGDPSFARTFAIPPSMMPTRRLEGHNGDVESVAWLSESQLISASIDGDILIWDCTPEKKARKPERSFTTDEKNALYCMKLAADGKQLLAGLGSKSENLRLWDVQKGEPMGYLEGQVEPVYSCDLTRYSSQAVSGSKLGAFCLHDIWSSKLLHAWKGHDGVTYSVDFDRSERKICSASADGYVKIFDTRALGEHKKAGTMIEDAAASGVVYQALWRGEHEIISCGDDYCIKRWDVRRLVDGPVTSYFGHTSAVRAICLSPDGRFLASGTSSGSVRIWLVDELGILKGSRDAVEKRLKTQQQQRSEQEDMLSAGTLERPDDLKQTIRNIEKLNREAQQLRQAAQERALLGCTQARLNLEGPAMPVSSIVWRDLGGGKARVATGSHDQSVRLYEVDTKDLEVVETWSK